MSYFCQAISRQIIWQFTFTNPLCQNPACWQESNHRANGQEYARRRDQLRDSLADRRGARGRARAVRRDAARPGDDVNAAVLTAGWLPVHRDQHELFESGVASLGSNSYRYGPKMGIWNISLKCPGCGGSARATLNDVTIEEQATPVSTTVQKYRARRTAC